jgi:hypothetical protein
MPVDDWAPEIKTHMEAVHAAAVIAKEIPGAGEVFSYNEWPGALLSFPSTLIGTLGGSQDYSVGGPLIAFHNVTLWVYFTQGLSLSEAQAMAWPFVERVRNRFAANMQLNSKVDSFHPPEHPALFYDGPGILEYAGRQFAGLIFNFLLKETETFTVSA